MASLAENKLAVVKGLEEVKGERLPVETEDKSPIAQALGEMEASKGQRETLVPLRI